MSSAAQGRHRRRRGVHRSVGVVAVPLAVGGVVAAVALLGPALNRGIPNPGDGRVASGPRGGDRESIDLVTGPETSTPTAWATARRSQVLRLVVPGTEVILDHGGLLPS